VICSIDASSENFDTTRREPMRRMVLLTALAAVALVPASAATRGRRLEIEPTLRSDKYAMPATFARRRPGQALSLLDEDVLLATAWMEPTVATEPEPTLIFDDQEEVDLFVAFLGGDTGGDVKVKLKLKGDTVNGKTKDKFREYIVDDDTVLTRWWSFGVLPRGRYRLRIKVRDGTRFGQGKSELHFEVLDLDG
jgi:hypothetical protein